LQFYKMIGNCPGSEPGAFGEWGAGRLGWMGRREAGPDPDPDFG
jgi:hypothetical protein